jgi:hypothetical protein
MLNSVGIPRKVRIGRYNPPGLNHRIGNPALGFAQVPGYDRVHRGPMTTKELNLDLKKLKARAFNRAEWEGSPKLPGCDPES